VFRTIRARLTLWYVALLALILFAFSGALYFLLAHGLYQQLDDSLTLNAHQLAGELNIQDGQVHIPNREAADVAALRARGYLIRLLDPQAQVIDINVGSVELPVPPGAREAALQGHDQFETVPLNGENYRLYTLPLDDNGQLQGMLQIAQNYGGIENTLRQLLVALSIIVPLTVLVATIGGTWFVQRALAPIDQITRAAQRISAQDLSRRLNLNLPADEIGRFASTFDAMLARLDDAFRREREFTANASHELRTPLTVMRGEIDVVLQRPRESAEYQRVLSELGTDVDQLARIAADLLLLARAEVNQLAVAPEPLHAAQLLHAVAEELRPVAESKQIALEVQADPALVFWADEQKMLRTLFNLVDNALKFSPPEKVVRLTAAREGERVSLRVSDQGCGIAPDALPYIFDRFYRGTNGHAPGAGLGLAIARALVLAQGGTLSVDHAAGPGTSFAILMPAEKVQAADRAD
jgi:heavy metal sensor kinase